jgi:Ca2+-binding RTX toxin-like protein
VLIGGRDDDMLIGQSGLDVLIGGLGADRAVGGSGEDVLIGGQTTYDHNQDAALTAALAIWTDPLASYEDRVTALDGYLTVIDDLEPDKLTGSAGRDLFYAGTGDVVTDQKANESDAGLMMLAQAAPGTGQVALLADAPAPVIDWSRPGEAGAPLAALPAWTSDFVNDGAQGEAERKRNGGFVVKIPAAPTAPVKG